MQWVWIHPYYRREGLLSAAWPMFKERFGCFLVERPFSAAMLGFFASQGLKDGEVAVFYGKENRSGVE